MWRCPCAAATAVEMAQGPAVPLLMGRPDRINETDPVGHFSTECFDPEQQIDFWGAAPLAQPPCFPCRGSSF